MKKLALSVAALALTVGGALAADLPSRKGPPVLPPPPPPPAPMWTGFYAGLNAGYGFGTNDNVQTVTWGQDVPFTGNTWGWHVPDGIFSNSTTLGSGLALSGAGPMTQNGFIGGAQIGYNYQWGSNFVIGLEADIQGSGIRGTSWNGGIGSASALSGYNVDPATGSYHTLESSSVGGTSVHAGVDWMGTVRGRLGYLFTPTMLVYATGGLTYGGAWAKVNQVGYANTLEVEENGKLNYDYGYTHTFVGTGQQAKTLVGWNVGGGLEWMFMPNWSVKAEAIYWNMGNMTVQHLATAAAPSPAFYDTTGYALHTVGASPAAAIGATRVNYQGVIARAGINYHFNWGGAAPVVARY